jgi:hypothetical protein
MIQCNRCGEELKNNVNFCWNCGNPINDIEKEEFSVNADDLVKTVKKLIHEGNIRRILIKDENGNRLLEIPVTIGLIGTVIAPWLAALGAIAAIATNCTIEIVRIKK